MFSNISRRFLAGAIVTLLTTAAAGTVHAGRFTVDQGQLIDNQTGLAWLSLDVTSGAPLPSTIQKLPPNWQAASADQLTEILIDLSGTEFMLSSADERYATLSFFARDTSAAPSGSSLQFGGWFEAGQSYELALYTLNESIENTTKSVTISGISTLGTYSSSFCPGICATATNGLFAVRPAIPESSTFTMGLMGLVAVAALWRKSRRDPD